MYVQGFLVPVPVANRDAYLDMASKAAPMFAEFGATRTVECWGDDIPDGKVTDFKRAVKAETQETVVFSWVAYPDKATCDDAAAKMMADERMKPPADMPFDGKRMVYGGFETIFEKGDAGKFGYVDGFVAAVPSDGKDKYVAHVEKAAGFFMDNGARHMVETWGVDVPDGKTTDFARAVAAKPDETVVFSWITWPDKPTRDAAMAKMMDDPGMRDMEMPFDGKRMIYGGFTPILDA